MHSCAYYMLGIVTKLTEQSAFGCCRWCQINYCVWRLMLTCKYWWKALPYCMLYYLFLNSNLSQEEHFACGLIWIWLYRYGDHPNSYNRPPAGHFGYRDNQFQGNQQR